MADYFSGRVHSVLWNNEDFYVLRVVLDSQEGDALDMFGQTSGTPIGVKGLVPGMNLDIGSWFGFEAKWETHPKFGRQLSITRAPVVKGGWTPETASAMLQSHGITERLVSRLNNAFGADLIKALNRADEAEMAALPGVTPFSAALIVKKWLSLRSQFQTLEFLADAGVPKHKISEVWSRFGDKAQEILTENPWALVRIEGIRFDQADEVALRLGLNMKSPLRVEGASLYAVKNRRGMGHLFLSSGDMRDAVQGIVGGCTDADVARALVSLHKEGSLTLDRKTRPGTTAIYEPWFRHLEQECATRLIKRVETAVPTAEAESPDAEALRAADEARRVAEERGRDRLDAALEATLEAASFKPYAESLSAVGLRSKVAWDADPLDYKAIADAALDDVAEGSHIELSADQRRGALNALVAPVSVLAGLPGTGKCLHPDTLVYTSEGFVELGALLPVDLPVDQFGEVDLTVATSQGFQKASHVYNGGVTNTLRVRLATGMVLEGTPEHPVKVMREGEEVWVQLCDVGQGDPVIQMRGFIQLDAGDNRLPTPPKKTARQWAVSFPEDMTPDLARYLGYIVSEGSVVDNSCVQITAHDPQIREWLYKTTQELFGFTPSIHHDKRYTVPVGIQFNRALFVQWLRVVGVGAVYVNGRTIPSTVLRSSKACLGAFLSAYFEGDGHVDPDRFTLGCGTSSLKLAAQIQTVLLGLGVVSTCLSVVRGGKPFYRVAVHGASYQKFKEEVGHHFTYVPEWSVSKPNLDLVLGVRSLVRQAMQEARPAKGQDYNLFYALGKGVSSRNPSRTQLRKMALYPGVQAETREKMFTAASDDRFYNPVVSIEPGRSQVVDLSVPVVHEFLGNGVICHNTTALQTVVSALKDAGVPFLLVAPTGIAAKRMSSLTRAPAATIHRAFHAKGWSKGGDREANYTGITGDSKGASTSDGSGEAWGFGPDNPHPARVVICDECFHWKQPILTEDGWEHIGKIVENKLPLRVWSRNPDTGILELKRIVRWLKKPNPRDLIKIDVGRTASTRSARVIRCTPEHKILTPSGYVRAGTLQPGDRLIVKGVSLHPQQRSILIGTILGDGRLIRGRGIRKSHQMAFTQGIKQSEYLAHKRAAFGDMASDVKTYKSGYKGGNPVQRFTICVLDELADVASEMTPAGVWPNGRERWSPSDDFIQRIDIEALGIWYADQGHTQFRKTGSGVSIYASLHTERFSEEDQSRLAVRILELTGASATVQKDGRGYFYLRFVKAESRVFLQALVSVTPSVMGWKVPGACKGEILPEHLDTCEAVVRSVTSFRDDHYKSVYDIEVKDHHNYVAGNIIVSNCSMLDQHLLFRILTCTHPKARLVLVGDPAQLPSVGPGNVLRDIINTKLFPTVELTEIYRQEETSDIILAAHATFRGNIPVTGATKGSDFVLLEQSDEDKVLNILINLVARLYKKNANTKDASEVKTFQVLSPRHAGTLGVTNLNQQLRTVLNPASPGLQEHRIGKETIREDDRVMVVKNNYKLNIFNGDVGKVSRIDRKARVIEIKLHGPPVVHVSIPFKEASKFLRLAYCVTVHKCVHPDTLTETSEGLLPIRDIWSRGNLATPKGERPYQNKVSNPEAPAIRLTTRGGYTLTTTPDHGIDVWDGQAYVRREVQDIQEGDILRLRLGTTTDPTLPALLPGKPSHDNHAGKYHLPMLMDPFVAEFLGLMVADGVVYPKGFRLAKRHEDTVDRFVELCRHLFKVETYRSFKLGAYHAEVNSTFLSAWLLGIGGLAPHDKSVPECVLRSDSTLQAKFLRGLFADGLVNLKDGRLDHIEWTCSSGVILNVARTMLLRFGIPCETTLGRDIHTVYIYGEYAKRFGEVVGFPSEAKHKRLLLPYTNQTKYFVPVSKTEAQTLRQHLIMVGHSTCGNAIQRGCLSSHNLNHLIDSGADTAVVKALQVRAQWHHEPVVSLEDTTCPTMCVEVSDGHRFLQNGFSAWNSQGQEYDAIVMPLVKGFGHQLQRNLFYTAITRAKKRVYLIGQNEAMVRAVHNNREDVRNTLFPDRLALALKGLIRPSNDK